ncbi:activating signal cointegrator 1 complex subunit 3-like [Octopus sinensis]|uniref:Activating signal cointegrator 1 complex subunit 3-like n=1 Tax=Octopus sinensis TaxID=2607531 RepID=A0A7E6EJD2_9MOLL|nr:activating signal cointegrator 1 complex subunit 3-like [Octopus sinensis]
MVQRAFQGVPALNCIQSTVFETVMNSQENVLISAPTGAGKTNIALLAILSRLRDHINHRKLPIEDLKVVYIAPMKALASEITAKFADRLTPFGLSVRELTGDMQLTRKEVSLTQVLSKCGYSGICGHPGETGRGVAEGRGHWNDGQSLYSLQNDSPCHRRTSTTGGHSWISFGDTRRQNSTTGGEQSACDQDCGTVGHSPQLFGHCFLSASQF